VREGLKACDVCSPAALRRKKKSACCVASFSYLFCLSFLFSSHFFCGCRFCALKPESVHLLDGSPRKQRKRKTRKGLCELGELSTL
jgi:hypothetical protein